MFKILRKGTKLKKNEIGSRKSLIRIVVYVPHK